jgi:sigma-B regulation protein RsbU (phosphoserine phosphatase)
MNWQIRPSTKILKIVFNIIAAYVLFTCLYFFIDAFFLRIFSNDQCVWVDEKVHGKNAVFIHDLLKDGVADRAGVKDGDVLVAIGDSIIENSIQAQRILNRFSPDDTVIYSVLRQGQVLTLPLHVVRFFNPVYLALALLGFGFLFIGWIVGVTRPQDRVPRLFFRMAMSGALLFVLLGPIFGPGYQGSLFWLINTLIAFVLFPADFVHFFIWFPYEKLSAEKRRWGVPALYLLSLCNFLMILFFNTQSIAISILFILMGSGFGVFTSSYFHLKEKTQRLPLRSILFGTAVGMSGFIYLFIMTSTTRAIFINHPELLIPVLVVVLIPLSFGYSIFRYHTMDVEIIINRSLVYAATTAHLALLYLILLFLMDTVLKSWIGGGSNNPFLHFSVLIMSALLFAPIKDRMQDFVDRRFFRERYDYQKALLNFSQELPGLTHLDEILQKVIYTIGSTMHIESMAIALYDANQLAPHNYVQRGILRGQCQLSCTPGGLIEWMALKRRAVLLYPVNLQEMVIPAGEKNILEECKIVLAVPMMKQEKLTGVLFMGSKLSQKVFSQEDLDLLTTVANQTAVAIENARLHVEEIEKVKLENEMTVARRIQQYLLPQKNPSVKGLDVAGVSIPALSVGGDYFDYIVLDEQRLLIAIGDVSGKGVSAGLYMSKTQGMIRIASGMFNSPREILVEVNKQMYHGMDRQSFITIILALIDMKQRKIHICRAGHNPAIELADGNLNLIQCKGVGVGLVNGEKFEQGLEEEIKPLSMGNTFVFYTDGVTEAMNENNEEFGDEKLFHLIQSHTSARAETLVSDVLSEVKKFVGSAEQHDDITIVVTRVTE